MPRRLFRGYWDCRHCGTIDIMDDIYDCPHCGKARDDNIIFHPYRHNENKPRHYVSSDDSDYRRLTSGPDWTCSYCDSNNAFSNTICRKCGHSKDEGDKYYFDHHPERKGIIPIDHGTNKTTTNNNRTVSSDANDNVVHYPPLVTIPTPPTKTKVDKHENDSKNYYPTSAVASTSLKPYDYSPNYRPQLPEINLPWERIGIIAIIIAAIISVFCLLTPKERTITITGVDWERSIVVEEYRTMHESDWHVPPGGRITSTRSEIHHYDPVLDHYETVTKTRTVVTGSHEEVVGIRDLGNGGFEEITTVVIDTEEETYTELEPQYVDVPVYQTKYYYDIERWVYDHTVTANGRDKEPYWPEVNLTQSQRESNYTEVYGIYAINKAKKTHYTLSYESWRNVSIGDIVHVKVYITGYVEIIDE